MIRRITLTESFTEFFENERSAGLMLMAGSLLSLIIANSLYGPAYLRFWESYAGPLTVSYWVNDGLMAIFFLLIGLELKRELYKGELSNFRNALLPIIAAFGGVIFPALIHFSLNAGMPSQAGIGIPMATDIAFALSILALAGDRVPASLKIFLTALAVIDDLIAIVVIAIFYTSNFSASYLFAALLILGFLAVLNRMRVASLVPYLLLGAAMWYFMLKSGVHPTIAGVLLAFTIPFTRIRDDRRSPSYYLEHFLHRPVAFFVLPIFALANTGIIIGSGFTSELTTPNSLGVILGLFLGKVAGVSVLSYLAVRLDICRLPLYMRWRHIVGGGFLAGIGFTMSIFITNLAFKGDAAMINSSKMAILTASIVSGVFGYFWLVTIGKTERDEENIDSFSYEEED